MTNHTEDLLKRMLSYNGCFDGYPSMTCADEDLIYAAVDENEAEMRAYEARSGKPFDNKRDPLQYLCYLASEHAKTLEQFDKARAFIADFIAACWNCNMSEGGNRVYAERVEKEGDCSLV